MLDALVELVRGTDAKGTRRRPTRNAGCSG